MDLSTGLDLDKSDLIGLGLIGSNLNDVSNQVWVRSNWMGQIRYGSNLKSSRVGSYLVGSGRVDPDLTPDPTATDNDINGRERR